MKTRKSKLDPHAELLAGMDAEKKTLAEMQAALAAKGVAVSLPALSGWLSQRRQREMQALVLGNISTGAAMNKEIEQAFARNPEPAIGTLVSYVKRLILVSQAQGSLQPELLDTANALFKSLLDYLKLEDKAKDRALDERRVALLEKKAAAFDAAKGVVESTLSPEEQRQRLKEILK